MVPAWLLSHYLPVPVKYLAHRTSSPQASSKGEVRLTFRLTWLVSLVSRGMMFSQGMWDHFFWRRSCSFLYFLWEEQNPSIGSCCSASEHWEKLRTLAFSGRYVVSEASPITTLQPGGCWPWVNLWGFPMAFYIIFPLFVSLSWVLH